MLLRSQMFVQSPLALLPRRWVAGRMQARLAHMPAPGSIPEPSRSRQYPEEPRVGVGVVILRNLDTSKGVEVVLIKRGTPPDMGKWSFPETIAECAIREAAEETGLRLRNDTSQAACRTGEVPTSTNACACVLLARPHPFTAADVIRRDQNTERIQWHYAIIEVAATPQDQHQAPQAAADADDARWVPISELGDMPGLSVNIAQVAMEARERFFACKKPL